jgi:hypothetical protein
MQPPAQQTHVSSAAIIAEAVPVSSASAPLRILTAAIRSPQFFGIKQRCEIF